MHTKNLLGTLLGAFSKLDDPRSPRGVRHPFAGTNSCEAEYASVVAA